MSNPTPPIPKLSIVMATADDFDGVYFTVQALRLYHDLSQCEIVVVDNKPDAPASKQQLKDFKDGKFVRGTLGTRYVLMPSPQGTAAPRERAIREARGEIVLCLDSHVMLPAGTIQKLIAWFDARPDFRGIVSGPILMDHFGSFETHFNPVWREGMWGVWGQAWEYEGKRFSVVENQDGTARYVTLNTGIEPLPLYDFGDVSTTPGPDLWGAVLPGKWAGHQQQLAKRGCRRLGSDDADEFEVPGQGLGLFAFRKTDWPGFNEHFRGFGGEELYIHEKVRRAGGQVLCLGFLKWLHRFARPGGVKYRLTNWDKCRNYVLGHLELGLDVEPVRAHFVDSGLLNPAWWDHLVADPVAHVDEPQAVRKTVTMETIFTDTKHTSAYFGKHMDKLREMAEQSERVVEFTRFHETTVALAAGAQGNLHSYLFEGAKDNRMVNELLPQLAGIPAEWSRTQMHDFPDEPDFEGAADLLVFKTPHCYERLTADLKRWAPRVRRWIVLHDTARNGMQLDNKRPGYAPQIKGFLDDTPAWFIASHTGADTGLTVLGCQDRDRPDVAILLWPRGYGPGTQLTGMMEEVGAQSSPTCSCKRVANYMDMLGVEGCRRERDELRSQILENWERWGWSQKASTAIKGGFSWLTGGVARQIHDKHDPVGSLIDLAIQREDERLAQEAKKAG